MKITLIMIQSLDGFISAPPLEKGEKSWWGSREDIMFFKEKTLEAGTLILGNTTFQTMSPKVFETRFGLIFTGEPEKYKNRETENIKFFKGTPEEALQYLESVGKKEAILAGGGNINGQFLKAGLVDEIYITIAPRVFGKGVPVFGGFEIDSKLVLVDTKKIGENEVLLHWKVLKEQ